MISGGSDSVTNIHRRWTITRLNPSSIKASISITLASAAVIVILSSLYAANGNVSNLPLSLSIGVSTILILSFLDYLALLGTPTNKISKVFHVAAFGNLLWSVVLIVGISMDPFFGYISTPDVYLLEGMLIVIAFRIALFRSVFGAGLLRSVGVSFIEPVLFAIILLGSWEFHNTLLQNPEIGIGSFFLVWAGVWSIVADKAGQPNVPSTFRLLQAFLSAWTEQRGKQIEEIFETKAKNNLVKSYILRFLSIDHNEREAYLILPGVHPGPFKPVGGSNLSYELFKIFAKRAMVVHGASDHSFNIPSKNELIKYLLSFASPDISEFGYTCTEPYQNKRGDFIVTAMAFHSVCLIILSAPSRGMEDVPDKVSLDLQGYATKLGFSKALVVDSHNAMGGQLFANDQKDLILCATNALDMIKDAQQYRFGAGFAACTHSADYMVRDVEDVGQGGLAVIAFKVVNKKFALGWVDSNSMDNRVRDTVLSDLKSHGYDMIEICTSDTHSTSGKRTRHGYYPLGSITDIKDIAEHFRQLVSTSFENIKECSFSLLLVESDIKVMGRGQFDDYSLALDRSMNLTKVFLAIAAAVALLMLIVS